MRPIGIVLGMRKGWQKTAWLVLSPIVLAGCFEDLTSADGGSLLVVSGNNQIGVVNTALPKEVRVRLADQDGIGQSGRTVTFSVQSGGGSVIPTQSVTDINGEATTSWTLGPVASDNQLRASSAMFPAANLVATAELTLFDVDLRFLTDVNDGQRTALHAASTRWRRTVTGDLADVAITAPAGQCGADSPALSETVDDLVIFVVVEPIDGVRGALASAGPCFVRTSNSMPLVGLMRLDEADLATLEQTGDLEGVLLHEMGHVLGVGTLWETAGLLADPSGNGGTDPHFTGAAAVTAFNDGGGSAYEGGKVPVEDTGGSGTRDGHWRESVLDTELMTGFLDPQRANPLSNITVGSLADLGYTVNANTADAFTVTVPVAARSFGSSVLVPLLADIYRGPIHEVLPDGTLRRIR